MDLQKKKRKAKTGEAKKKFEILRQLIAESTHIIENKCTMRNINIEKTKAWKISTNRFNKVTGKNRTVGELKLAWKRMKLMAKANLSAHKIQNSKTGDGEKPPSPSPEDLAVMVIVPYDFIIEVNDYDSDTVQGNDTGLQPKPISRPSKADIIDNQKDESETRTAEKVLPKVEIRKHKKHKPTNTPNIKELIMESNIDFKKRQMEMLEEEHVFNIKIAELKIKKLQLEISLLADKKTSQ